MTEGHIHAGGRRKNQDYSTCLAFLPEGVWSRILKAPSDRLRADEVVYFLYTVLQLRLPTEHTYAVLTGLLASFDPRCSSFDLRTKLQTVKTAWSNMKSRLSRDHVDPAQLLRKLPGNFDDLTEELRARFGQTRPLFPWPIDSQEVDRQTLRVPIRSTHASLQEDKRNPMEALADMILARAQQGRSSGDLPGGLKNLKIFSPARRSNKEAVESEKQSHLQLVAAGQASRKESVLASQPSQVPLCLEDQPRAVSTTGDGPTSVPAKRVSEAISTRDADLVDVSTGDVLGAGTQQVPARDVAQQQQQQQQQQQFPAREVSGQLKQPGRQSVEQSTYEAHSHKFLEARQVAKAEKVSKEMKEEGHKSANKGISPNKGLKSPAAAFKRPAAKRPREEERVVTMEEPKHKNEVFRAKTYGKCKVEYYTHKSYIRRFEEEGKKWVMVLGSTHPKHHKQVCALLVPYVKGGCKREALLRAREEILTELGD